MNTDEYIHNALISFELFKGVSSEDIKDLIESVELIHVKKNKVIHNAKVKYEELCFIVSGSIRLKRVDNMKHHASSTLKFGDMLGDLDITELHVPNNIEAVALENVIYIRIRKEVLLNWKHYHKNSVMLFENLAKINIQKVRVANLEYSKKLAKQKQHQEQQKEFSNYVVGLVLALSLAFYMSKLTKEYFISTPWISSPIFNSTVIGIIIFPILMYVKIFKYSAEDVGIHLKKWQFNVSLGIVLGAIGCGLIFAIFYWAVYMRGLVSHVNVQFDFHKITLFTIGLYAVSSFVQEFLARGVAQKLFIDYTKNVSLSIFISSFMFSLAHAQVGISLTLITFVASMVNGYVYQRTKSLIAPTISHFMGGMLAEVLGLISY